MIEVVNWRKSPKLTNAIKKMIREYAFDLLVENGWHSEEWTRMIKYQPVMQHKWNYKTSREEEHWFSYGDALAIMRHKKTGTIVEFQEIMYSDTEILQCIGPVI